MTNSFIHQLGNTMLGTHRHGIGISLRLDPLGESQHGTGISLRLGPLGESQHGTGVSPHLDPLGESQHGTRISLHLDPHGMMMVLRIIRHIGRHGGTKASERVPHTEMDSFMNRYDVTHHILCLLFLASVCGTNEQSWINEDYSPFMFKLLSCLNRKCVKVK